MQPDVLAPSDSFAHRHIGPQKTETAEMLDALGYKSLDELAAATIPPAIRLNKPLCLGEPLGEHELLEEMKNLAADNQVMRSFIGQGYYDTIVPPVILRNVLENPGWYTQYTPYQAEISQGRLEALINFQTMIEDLTALPLANASLLDEGTAAAEAMHMCFGHADGKRSVFWVHDATHPQTIAVMRTRSEPIGIDLRVGTLPEIVAAASSQPGTVAGVLLSYPSTDGQVIDLRDTIAKLHAAGAVVACATDLLALTLITPPGELGADIAIGTAQRFGVPMGFGGPHAAFLSTRDDFRRQIPGRIIGVSRDARGKVAFRLALQTREQHIRREKATSNICTAQVLLAVMSSMYAVYHGPGGLVRIAQRVRAFTALAAAGLGKLGYKARAGTFFDTLRVDVDSHAQAKVLARALERGLNLRRYDDGLGISCDETTSHADLHDLLEAFAPGELPFEVSDLIKSTDVPELPAALKRTSAFLTHPTFSRYDSEHEMLRYLHRLSAKDLSLTTSMIPLGSCTMKLNATTEMIPVTWPEFGRMHPFAPAEQWGGYRAMFEQLEGWLSEITGFAAVSLQPNSGAQGEYAGLLAIRAYHHARGERHRTVCLIPQSAHGTNPASAVMVGMQVVVVATAPDGTIDLNDLRAKAEQHAKNLAAIMVTYPSTHGVFEEGITELCSIIHKHGGQVYMDGANMNAQVGLTRPTECGADVCHLNLHKTFCAAAGTQIATPNGVTRPIEHLLSTSSVYGWSQGENGVRGARLDAVWRTGRKPCVQVTLQDGRTITCTPDHRVRTTEGWIEAGNLIASRHRIVMGPELPVDDVVADAEAERAFRAEHGGLVLTMDTAAARERALAFFRLVGALCSDGTYSETEERGRPRPKMLLHFGTRYDAERALADVRLLTGKHPAISKSRSVFAVALPKELIVAIAALPGMCEPGRRVVSSRTVPDFVSVPTTPRALLREFLGALFGGDGHAPSIVHLMKAPATMKPVGFRQTRDDTAVLQVMQHQLIDALSRLGVEATADAIVRVPVSRLAKDRHAPRWTGGITVIDGLAFAERVGFRYCAHKTARLSAAAAYWRMKRNVNTQRVEVAKRALAKVTVLPVRFGPKGVWASAVAGAYQEVASVGAVLSPSYASFAGTKRVSKQVLINAVEGQKSSDPTLRRTHRRILAASVGRGGEKTGVVGLKDFLKEIGALGWFNKHTKQGDSYKVTYAMSQDAVVEPTFHLGVIDVREVGEREVYDLTVDELHSFLANGAVVHNCIPHGGGGPGMGPIAVAKHLAPYLPGHPLAAAGSQPVGPVSAAPWGSASILPISFAYIAMMGEPGLRRATEVAILGANYIAKRLGPHFPVLYTDKNGRVAHELILDCRGFKKTANIEAEDIAKRLMDYGFHAPTMSFPVPGTLMVEPTESESKAELDRFCDAMIAIRQEISAIETGQMDRTNNPLKHAPHTAAAVASTEWDRPYTREQAAYPLPYLRTHKYWPPVARVDNAYGDRNLVCACPPVDAY